MATVQLAALAADIRGSIGGLTFSRNMGGAFIRTRVKPINPQSARQVSVRTVLAALSARWSAVLTADQRDAWDAYADGTTWSNRLGLPATITGLAAYCRTNTLRLQAALAVADVAPELAGHAASPDAVVKAFHDTDRLSVETPSQGFNPADPDDHLFVFGGLPLSAGSLRIPNRFRYAGVIIGATPVPPAFPVTFWSPWPIADGHRVTVGLVHVDPDNRVSYRVHKQVAASPSI